jgi:NTP pyrophosphatase (non-canonical NTP hydrolase)
MNNKPTTTRPESGPYIRFTVNWGHNHNLCPPSYLPLSGHTSDEMARAFIRHFKTATLEDCRVIHDVRGVGDIPAYSVTLTLCFISKGQEVPGDTWGTYEFHADGKGGVLENREQPSMPLPDKAVGIVISQYQAACLARTRESFQGLWENWSLADWGNAMAGECGEACNFIKKIRRLDTADKAKDTLAYRHELFAGLGKELVDTFTYMVLLAAAAGIDLEAEIVAKFNEISDRRGSAVKIS